MLLSRASNALVLLLELNCLASSNYCNPYRLNVILKTGRKWGKLIFIYSMSLWTRLLTLGSCCMKLVYMVGRTWRTPCPEWQGQLLEDSEWELMPNLKVLYKICLYKSWFSVFLCKGLFIFCISSKYNSLVCPEWTMWKIKWCFPFPGVGMIILMMLKATQLAFYKATK